VCGWQVKLCDPLVTRGRYRSALEIKGLYIKRYINSSVYFFTFTVFVQQHYTVRSLEVMAECTCTGHDIDCLLSNSTGSYECVCGGNTTGRYCDECLPFYNQQPFRYGIPCEGLIFLLLLTPLKQRQHSLSLASLMLTRRTCSVLA